VNLVPKQNNDEHAKRRLNCFVVWMNKLAAAFREEISLETQAVYIESLADVHLDRLDEAFKRVLRECKFLPSIAEIRDMASHIAPSEAELAERKERDQRAREKLNEQIAWSRKEAERIENEQQQRRTLPAAEHTTVAGLSETEVEGILKGALTRRVSREWTESDHQARLAELARQKAILLERAQQQISESEPVSEPQTSEPKKGDQL
jgi:small-conductance mechanosensitive channel